MDSVCVHRSRVRRKAGQRNKPRLNFLQLQLYYAADSWLSIGEPVGLIPVGGRDEVELGIQVRLANISKNTKYSQISLKIQSICVE